MKEFAASRAKTQLFNGQQQQRKKSKRHKKVCHKRKLTLEDYKNCLEAATHKNKINQLEKNKVNVDSLRKKYKGFMRKGILKSQQRFKNEKQCTY